MGASATASVADVIDSFKFTAGESSGFVGFSYSFGTALTSPSITMGKFIDNEPGNQATLVEFKSLTSGLLILRLESDFFYTGGPIESRNPEHTFSYMVVKDSTGAEIAEFEGLAGLENNSSSSNGLPSRQWLYVNGQWLYSADQNTIPHLTTVTVVDADTFTVPLTLTRRNRVVPSGASETFTGGTGKVYKPGVDVLTPSAGAAVSTSSLSSNVVTINTNASHGLSSGDKVNLAGIAFSSYDPNTLLLPNLTGGYNGDVLLETGEDYTVEFRNRL